MALKDIIIRPVVVMVGETPVEVKGLTLADIEAMVTAHHAELASLFEGTTSLSDLAVKSPDFLALLIAHGAGEPDMVATVKGLPLGKQIELVTAVWEQTALDIDSLGKFLGVVMSVIKKVGSGLNL